MRFGVALSMFVWSLACASVCEAGAPGGFAVVSPAGGATIETPLTATLTWTECSGASSYLVRVHDRRPGLPIVLDGGLRSCSTRVALRPETTYEWSVSAIGPKGKVLATTASAKFTTPKVALHEVTDPNVLFEGWHPGARFCNIDPLPVDENAKVSPWFGKKTYRAPAPPSFEKVKPSLPVPIWDGHQDAIDMYWYSWQTLFTTWVYRPEAGSKLAVSNMLGMPTWAGWGSTMVWDSAFILQFARYCHRGYPIIDSLDNCYARQHESGFICRESDNANREVNSVWPVNLSLLPWAEWNYYLISGDSRRLTKVFLPLVKQYEWMAQYQRRASGLYWNEPVGDGMDDSPRNAARAYVTATSAMAMSADMMSRIAREIDRPDLAGWFAREYAGLKDLINASLWDSAHNIYNDVDADGKPITSGADGTICKHVGCFWPMIAGVVPADRAAFLAAHLADPKSFNRLCGTASLSADSSRYNSDTGSYWLGAVWPPTQYMVTEGLRKCGNQAMADYLVDKYYNALLAAYKAKGDITEFIAPDRPAMYGHRQFVGWGGLGPVSMLIEDILGIRADAPSSRVEWRITRTEKHGIRNLSFGDRTVSLVCSARSSEDDAREITIDANAEFDLSLYAYGTVLQKHISAGRTTFTIAWSES